MGFRSGVDGKGLRNGVVSNVLMRSARGYYVGSVEFVGGDCEYYDYDDCEPSASTLEGLLRLLAQNGDISRYLTIGELFTLAVKRGYVDPRNVSSALLASDLAFGDNWRDE